MEGLAVRVLGVLDVRVDGVDVEIPGILSRRLLASFAVSPGHAASTDDLIERVWGESTPGEPLHALRQHLSVLRGLLASPDADPVIDRIERDGTVYRLIAEDLDLRTFEETVRRGHVHLGAQRWTSAATAFHSALALWRGPALQGLTGTPRLDAAAAQLEEQRIDATEAWADALLREHEGGELIAPLQQALVEQPFRERLRGQLMLALYRAGRQADALDLYQDGRTLLADHLGLEPSQDLQDLEVAILRHDPWLQARRRPSAAHRRTLRRSTLPATVRLPDGQLLALDRTETLLGRDPIAHVQLVDERVSRLHARIREDEAGFRVEDLGSTNGVQVNGERVDEHPLQDGDVISLGGVDLKFRAS